MISRGKQSQDNNRGSFVGGLRVGLAAGRDNAGPRRR